ncbi:tail fiber protein [Flavivirga jejuensis]|uniref:Tail fiber protein n=1 Tax=Flavivirga jejuensis TaxID=870487 RepID=A0ABT8WMZ1_9FLAO|nr:tail fiber protein [Flavivirga jejuensis]MDO5974521.1 tail fiber protein [Flavivirga jejuensis]
MKKQFFITCFCLSITYYLNAQNTFPASGNVGIGTTNPTSKLDVIGDINANGGIVSESNYGLTISPNANDAIIKRGTPGNLMVCSGGGNSSIFLNYAYGSGNSGVKIYDGGTINYGQIKISSTGDLSLFSKSGNVGIGTTTPDSKLTVAGKIHAQEIKVAVNAGADFVFEDNYKLPNLKDTEAFIKKNKHLPEIASEKDMQENGLLIAEMNIKLLQKIEELTLYTIDQEKRIESLESKNEKLIALVEKLINKKD